MKRHSTLVNILDTCVYSQTAGQLDWDFFMSLVEKFHKYQVIV